MKTSKPRRTQDGRKHHAILQAAIRLFLKHGYSKTSMDAIAAAAGVTKQTIYAHYHSKNALFTQIVEELCRKHAPTQAVLANKGQSVEALLYKLGLAFLNMVTSKEGLAATRLVVAEAQRHPALALRYYETVSRRMLSMVADALEQENRRGAASIPNTLSAASYFFSMLKGNYYLRTLLNISPHPSPGEKEKHVRETVKIFMHLYGSSSPLHTSNVL